MAILQQAPPDTIGYMIAGYFVIFGVMLFYLVSLGMRRRNLDRDREILEELEDRDREGVGQAAEEG